MPNLAKKDNMSTYKILLHAHSGFRWLALLLPLIILVKSMIGFYGKKEYQKIDRILASSFAGTVHLMLLLGISLYFFFSPITQAAFADFSAAMKNPSIRFWAVEHISIMTLVTIIVTIGSTKTKKALSSESKFKNQLVFFGISLALMLISIPWDRV
jgi:Na+-driven multidrug efflux pump